MKQYTYNGETLTPGSTFVTDGVRHPPNWASVWGPADYERWGIVVTDLPVVPPSKEQLRAYAAEKRWVYETGGMELPGGLTISTDTAAQTKIAAAKAAFDSGALTGTIAFKTDAGFIDADAEDVTNVYLAVIQHVQGAYVIERETINKIETEVITTFAEVDAEFAP